MKPSEKGYTLMELLIAMSLLVGVVAVLVGGLRFENRVWQRANDNTEKTMQLAIFQDVMFRWIQQAYPYEDITGDRLVVYPFDGQEAELTFSAPLFVGGQNDGLYRIHVQYDETMGQIILIAVVDRNGQNDPTKSNNPITRTILSDVDTFDVKYLQGIGNQSRWVNKWERKRDLPIAIKVRVKGEVTKGVWLEVLAKPKITKEAQCLFDPVSRDCRSS